MDIDGQEIVRWFVKADKSQLGLLIGAEYSDTDDIWLVEAADERGLTVANDADGRRVRRDLPFFQAGTFFFKDELGKSIQVLIRETLTEGDKRVLDARNLVSSGGFSLSDLGNDSNVISLADAIRAFDIRGVVPNGDVWEEIRLIFSRTEKSSLMRCGIRFVEKWVEAAEISMDGRYDIYRRVLLAYLFRHTNQLDKALSTSDVVDLPRSRLYGGDGSVAVLATTRAASMMDLAERVQQKEEKCAWLARARRSIDKANAIGGGDSQEIMFVYRRLKKMQKDNDCLR